MLFCSPPTPSSPLRRTLRPCEAHIARGHPLSLGLRTGRTGRARHPALGAKAKCCSPPTPSPLEPAPPSARSCGSCEAHIARGHPLIARAPDRPHRSGATSCSGRKSKMLLSAYPVSAAPCVPRHPLPCVPVRRTSREGHPLSLGLRTGRTGRARHPALGAKAKCCSPPTPSSPLRRTLRSCEAHIARGHPLSFGLRTGRTGRARHPALGAKAKCSPPTPSSPLRRSPPTPIVRAPDRPRRSGAALEPAPSHPASSPCRGAHPERPSAIVRAPEQKQNALRLSAYSIEPAPSHPAFL